MRASYEKYSALRDERGMLDYSVAKETGIDTATISNWKSGKYEPKLDKIAAIAKVFHVPVNELYEE